MRRAESRDRIHDKQRFRAAQQTGNAFYVVPRAGLAFCRLHVDGACVARKLRFHFTQRNRGSVRRLDEINLALECLGQIAPSLAEFSGGEHQDAICSCGCSRRMGCEDAGAAFALYLVAQKRARFLLANAERLTR